MRTIHTDSAPEAVGPYSQAVKAGDFLFCSGQLGIDPRTGKLAGEEVSAQTGQAMDNLIAVLHAAGLNVGNIVKTTIFLTDLESFPEVNRVYSEKLGKCRPSRSTVEVSRLPREARIEIDCIAFAPPVENLT